MPAMRAACFRGSTRGSRRRAGDGQRRLAILEAECLELLAHFVDIQPELTCSQSLALVGLVGDTLLGGLAHTVRLSPADHDDAVVVCEDCIAGLYACTRAHHGHVHRAKTGLHSTLSKHRLAP